MPKKIEIMSMREVTMNVADEFALERARCKQPDPQVDAARFRTTMKTLGRALNLAAHERCGGLGFEETDELDSLLDALLIKGWLL